MEATRLSNTKGLSVPLDHASTILARVEAERDSLRAENAKLREALALIERSDTFKGGTFTTELQKIARAALAGSR